jgi:hypothetical protein
MPLVTAFIHTGIAIAIAKPIIQSLCGTLLRIKCGTRTWVYIANQNA